MPRVPLARPGEHPAGVRACAIGPRLCTVGLPLLHGQLIEAEPKQPGVYTLAVTHSLGDSGLVTRAL